MLQMEKNIISKEMEEMKGYLIHRIDTFKEILKKYNEKVTDINVGSIGDDK